jgi:hypothetical protein
VATVPFDHPVDERPSDLLAIEAPIGVAAFVIGVARLRESGNPAGGRADWVERP